MTIASWSEAELRRFVLNIISDPSAVPQDRKLTELRKILGQVKRLASGVQMLTVAAGSGVTDSPKVTHGLTILPEAVVAVQNDAVIGMPSILVVQATSINSDTFQLHGEFRTGTWAAGGTIPVGWVAIA